MLYTYWIQVNVGKCKVSMNSNGFLSIFGKQEVMIVFQTGSKIVYDNLNQNDWKHQKTFSLLYIVYTVEAMAMISVNSRKKLNRNNVE